MFKSENYRMLGNKTLNTAPLSGVSVQDLATFDSNSNEFITVNQF